MGKSIVWTTATRKIEFARTKSNDLSMTISSDKDSQPEMSINLTVEDLRGISSILDDERRDLEWEIEQGKKEVTNG